MADFSKFKIGNTSYNVKDAAAGKSLSISGTDLSLKNAAGTAISTVTLPSGGGGKFVWLTGMSSSNSMSIQMVVDETSAVVSKFQDMRLAANTGSYVFLVDAAFNASGTVYALTSIEKVQGVTPIEYTITFSGKDGKWVGQCADTADPTTLTLSFTANGGSANTNIAFIAQSSGWPTLNTIYSITGTYKLTNQIGIKATGYGQFGPYEKAILATGLLIDDTYASAEDYLATNPQPSAALKIVAWFVVDANRIAKVTANCTYGGNGEYVVSSASATSVTYVGE